MERLLTKEEINEIKAEFEIEREFLSDFSRKIYKSSYPITEILSISSKNLIMIKGNSDTGYDHIRERHNFFTTKIYTKKKQNGEIGFQNQSKFPNNIAPIDFLKIANDIYSPENEVIDNLNEGAKYFDLYLSSVTFPDFEKPESVRLLVYKNTKIIHSLFPVRDTFSRKIKQINNFPFRRDKVEVEFFRNDTFIQVRIPYVDVNEKLWYSIFIDKDFIENIEKWRILIFLGHHISKYSIDYHEQSAIKLNLYKSFYQYSDLRITERFIKDFDEKFKSGLINLPEDN